MNLNGEARELTSCEAIRLRFMRTELDIVFISLEELINRRLVELAYDSRSLEYSAFLRFLSRILPFSAKSSASYATFSLLAVSEELTLDNLSIYMLFSKMGEASFDSAILDSSKSLSLMACFV